MGDDRCRIHAHSQHGRVVPVGGARPPREGPAPDVTHVVVAQRVHGAESVGQRPGPVRVGAGLGPSVGGAFAVHGGPSDDDGGLGGGTVVQRMRGRGRGARSRRRGVAPGTAARRGGGTGA